jgi:chemotaxis signal transduction protein
VDIVSSRFLLTFSMVDWTFGMPLEGVQEVQRMVELVPLPETPGGPRGVINLRGETVPVWDLRSLVGFPSVDVNPDQNIIILRVERQDTQARADVSPTGPVPSTSRLARGLGAGFPVHRGSAHGHMASSRQGWIVDQVHEVLDAAQGQPAPFQGVPVAEYLAGVIRMGEGLVLVLDVPRLLRRAEDLAHSGFRGV